MSCGIGHRHSLDLGLLWRRLAAAALIRPPAWELQYTMGAALKRKEGRKEDSKQDRQKESQHYIDP